MNLMFPEDILTWFKSRGISEATLRNFGIWWNGQKIVIPIKDQSNKTLFSKYRRNPSIEEGPKYTYDKGANISLYNYDPSKKNILFCEGELDVVRLSEAGIYATTSTGGAGSFQSEWLEVFKDKPLIVCFDNDEAGMRGMLKIALLRPETRFISFPEYWNGKDITDFLTNHSIEEFKTLLASAYELPVFTDFKKSLNLCTTLRRTLKYKKLSQKLLEHYVIYLNEEKLREKTKKDKKEFTEDINNIKSIPITDFIDFDMAGFARCIWHKSSGRIERTPSLHYYQKTNTVYCFACCKYADVISVVRETQNLSFIEAVNFLKEKYGIKN